MQANLVSDNYLVEKVQMGNSEALDTLIRRHQDRAYKYAFRLTRDVDEAADVVANAFVRIHRSIGTFKGQSSFTTWLYRIITNCFLDMKKKAETRPVQRLETMVEGENGEFLDLPVAYDGPSPFDECLRKDKNEAIFGVLGELTDYQRAILVMYHVELLSYEEIAEALDTPMGTVKSRLNRSRRALAGQVSEYRSLFVDSDQVTVAA